jgi:hypothetical protein
MPDQRHIDKHLLCPSARCAEGALLIGLVGAEGKVGYIKPTIPVDKEFVEQALTGRAPEQRFRFAAPCQESGCIHWTGTKCGVIDQARVAVEATQTERGASHSLPKCGIRPHCRWFAQTGSDACSACPFIFNYAWPDAPLATKSQ